MNPPHRTVLRIGRQQVSEYCEVETAGRPAGRWIEVSWYHTGRIPTDCAQRRAPECGGREHGAGFSTASCHRGGL
jgi:hypothetical protein